MKALVEMVGILVLVLPQVVAQGPGQGSTLGSESKPGPADASSEYVALGEPIQMVAPRYPKHALKEHIQGNVVLRLSVNTGGQVRDISPISGDPELAEAATNAVRFWAFVPYFQNDRPAKALTKVTILFRIDDMGRPEVSAMYDAPKPPPDNPVFKAGEGVTAPKALYAPDPYYTQDPFSGKVRGAVELSVVILPNGTTDSARVTKGLHPDLDAKAVELVGHWRFKPATKDGKAVAVLIHVAVEFN